MNNQTDNCIKNGDTLEHEIIGYSGAFGVSLILLPQVRKTYKDGNVEGISLTFLLLNLWTSGSFLIYGMLEEIMPMIISNTISLLSCISLLIMYCKWCNKNRIHTIENNINEKLNNE